HRREPFADALVGRLDILAGDDDRRWRGFDDGGGFDDRRGGLLVCDALGGQPLLAELTRQCLDLQGHLVQVVMHLIRVVTTTHRCELASTDLFSARKEWEIEIGHGGETPSFVRPSSPARPGDTTTLATP